MTEFGSACSGIEAASVAWHPLGWKTAWLAEIDRVPSQILAHNYPGTPNLGDMTQLAGLIQDDMVDAPDVFVTGTPCQSYSLAGLKGGMADPRGQLTLEYVRIANAIDEQRARLGKPAGVCVWENVPGVLRSADNAFGYFLAGIAGAEEALVPEPRPANGRSSRWWRWDSKSSQHFTRWPDAGFVSGPQRAVAWRVLDAQHFGLAQRRRRIFLVASARTDIDPGQLLFEFDQLRRDLPPERKEVQTATTVVIGGVTYAIPCWWDGGHISQTLDAVLHKGQMMPEKTRFPAVITVAHTDVMPCMVSGGSTKASKGAMSGQFTEHYIVPVVVDESQLRVRKMMPVECERLMGFKDGHTAAPINGVPLKDTPRYKSIGNSMPVIVMNWLGKRIDAWFDLSTFDDI